MNNNFNVNENDNLIKEEKKDLKGITFLAVGILTIVVAIAGATFAWFAVTASNNNVIKGDSGYTASSLTLTVTETSAVASASKKLVPQLDAAVKTAANSTNKCIDANGNGVCQHYTITIKNNTTTKFYLDGSLTLTAANMPNLKWGICSAAWTCTSTTYNPKTTTTLVSRAAINGGATLTYYVVLWISEKNAAQTDSGSLTGVVAFTGYNSSSTSSGQFVAGVTSTIRS